MDEQPLVEEEVFICPPAPYHCHQVPLPKLDQPMNQTQNLFVVPHDLVNPQIDMIQASEERSVMDIIIIIIIIVIIINDLQKL